MCTDKKVIRGVGYEDFDRAYRTLIQRRTLLSLVGGSILGAVLKPKAALPEPKLPQEKENFSFICSTDLDEMHHVSEGYEVDIILSLGDPIFSALAQPFSFQALIPRARTAIWL